MDTPEKKPIIEIVPIEESKIKSRSERKEQAEFVSWFKKTYVGLPIAAIPNGGVRGKYAAVQAKVEGVCPGMPDLVVPGWYLYIEMKRRIVGKLGAQQRKIKKYLESLGYVVIVCKGFAQAKHDVMKFVELNQEIIERELECRSIAEKQR